MSSCIFCDSHFADPIAPACRQKICQLFEVSFNGKRALHDGKMCTRCQTNVEMIECTVRLKEDMNQCLREHLAAMQSTQVAETPAAPPAASGGAVLSLVSCDSPPTVTTQSPKPVENGFSSPHMMSAAPTAPEHPSAAVTPTVQPPVQQQQAMLPPQPMQQQPLPLQQQPLPPQQQGVFLCAGCCQSFPGHGALRVHELTCSMAQQQNASPSACDRCNQNLKYRTPEERAKHMLQCQGRGLRRGRPSTGIFKCPKCSLSLKNRMNHDRLNHVQRCTGSGLKRGRPSLKSVEKFQCEKCGRNLWSREQLEIHVSKCDGSHVERRGRKPGDNTCPICNENQVYRHILKKHMRQIHGINAQNLDDTMMTALKLEPEQSSESPVVMKTLLMQQIQQQQSTLSPSEDVEVKAEPFLSSSAPVEDSSNHRKQGRPCRYVPEIYSCDMCNKRFEHKVLFDQHCCFKLMMKQNEGDDNSNPELVIATNENPDVDVSSSAPANQTNGHSEVPPISTRTLKPKSPPAKGLALAQVVSDLLGGGKSTTNTTMLQSIST